MYFLFSELLVLAGLWPRRYFIQDIVQAVWWHFLMKVLFLFFTLFQILFYKTCLYVCLNHCSVTLQCSLFGVVNDNCVIILILCSKEIEVLSNQCTYSPALGDILYMILYKLFGDISSFSHESFIVFSFIVCDFMTHEHVCMFNPCSLSLQL